ncbi:energy-coupling factor transporter transmembrane protein EcfT [Cytobacillus suaedae]|nr:energy-coupling factor transporter transmembrane protein EcfT [Cytobacillus suaedae]
MQINFSFEETWLHKINPSVKLLTMIFLLLIVLFIHNLNFMVNFAIITLILYCFFTGHPTKRVLLFSIPFVIVFISTASSMILFGKGDTTWFKWGLISISEESFYRGIHIGFRALTFAALGLTFALTTRPVYLFYSLMQQLKLKPKYAYSFMAAVRLIPIMIEEFQTIRNAMKVRGGYEKGGFLSVFSKIKSYTIPLLSQSIRRAHRIAVAMEAKGFSDTTKRTYYYQIGYSKYDLFFIVYFVIMLLVGYVLAINLPYLPATDIRHN